MEDISLIVRRCKRSNEPKLSLAAKGLMSVPHEILNLAHLQSLDLSNNKLVTLDPAISQLQQLKILDLSNNSLLELPFEISKLKNLQQLILTNNPLTSEFDELLQSQNQSQPNLTMAINRVFNIEQSSQQSVDAVNKLIDVENMLQEEKKRNQQLLKQVSTGSSYGTVLEVEATEFEIKEIVSQGGFSIVHRALLRGTEVALKKIFNPNITPELMDEINNEINMLATLRHPNIVLLMAVTTKPPNMFIATEYIPYGTLFNLLHKSKNQVSDKVKISIALQTARVLHYLHQSGIVHRDIKSHNILLDENYKVKLCDFGLARKIQDLNQGTMQFSGTPVYMAPELFQKKAYDKGVDLFAFGTMLWELFARQVPYEGLEPQDIMQKVVKGDQLNARAVPRPVGEMVSRLRAVECGKRPGFDWVIDELGKL